jgi:hypothetical protein
MFHSTLSTRLKHYSGLDRAILFSVLGRIWTMLSGLGTLSIITHFLTPNQQGYYYTFYSLVGVQVLFELGFSFVILQFAAHERSALTLHADGTIEGNPVTKARLASVLQKAVRWYSFAAVLMAIGLTIMGFRFFSTSSLGTSVAWKGPWLCLVIANSVVFQLDPIISFLEGCGKVSQVGRLRMTQGIIATFLSWGAMVLHHGLYSPFMVISGQAIMAGAFVYQHRNLLLPLLRMKTGEHAIRWSTEILPFQWRIAVSWASAYFVLQIMNPVAFRFCSPAEAGALGMSLTIAGTLGAVPLAWMTTKAAPFGALIAKKDYAALDSLFFRALTQSTVILLAGIIALLGVLPVLFSWFPRFHNRVLSLPYVGILLLATVCNHVTVGQAYYLRAHKKEPFLFFWVFLAAASGTLLVLFAKRWGLDGVVWAYFLCAGLLRVSAATHIFLKKRREWHAEVPRPNLELIEAV